MKQITNGLDVRRLLETIAAVDAQPELAPLKFRFSNRWIGAAANESRVQGFYGCAQELQDQGANRSDATDEQIRDIVAVTAERME